MVSSWRPAASAAAAKYRTVTFNCATFNSTSTNDLEVASRFQGGVEGIHIDRHGGEVLDVEVGGPGAGARHFERGLPDAELGEDVVERLKRLLDLRVSVHARHLEPGRNDTFVHRQILPLRAWSAESSRVPPRPSP